MSDKKPKISNLFSSTEKSTSSHSKRESSDEDINQGSGEELKRRASLPKIFGSVSKRRPSDVKPLLQQQQHMKEEDFNALLEAATSKHAKKLKLSSVYAPKKQVCEMQVQLLKAIADANDRIDQLQKDNISLTFRVTHLEKECFTLQSVQNSQRNIQFLNVPVADNEPLDSPGCFSALFL